MPRSGGFEHLEAHTIQNTILKANESFSLTINPCRGIQNQTRNAHTQRDAAARSLSLSKGSNNTDEHIKKCSRGILISPPFQYGKRFEI